MATLTLKGIPDDLLADLKRIAAEQRRSLNSEILVRLERSVGRPRRDIDSVLADIDELRTRLALPAMTDDELRAAIEDGRR